MRRLKSGPRARWQITYEMQDSATFLEKSGSRFCLSPDKDASTTFGDTLQKAALAAVAHKGPFHSGGGRNTLSTQMPSLQARNGRTQTGSVIPGPRSQTCLRWAGPPGRGSEEKQPPELNPLNWDQILLRATRGRALVFIWVTFTLGLAGRSTAH